MPTEEGGAEQWIYDCTMYSRNNIGTSAALMSENKKLVIPASSDSLPTSANQEDHVSMGGYASRKVLSLIDNLTSMLSIEFIMACQAIDIISLSPSAWVHKVYQQLRKHVPFIENDVFLGEHMHNVERLIHDANKEQALGKPFDFDFLTD